MTILVNSSFNLESAERVEKILEMKMKTWRIMKESRFLGSSIVQNTIGEK